MRPATYDAAAGLVSLGEYWQTKTGGGSDFDGEHRPSPLIPRQPSERHTLVPLQMES